MVTGWAALRLAGAAWFDGEDHEGRPRPVPLLIPHTMRIRVPGIAVTRTRRPLPLVVERHGVPCAPTARALIYELGESRSLLQAGVAVDMALAAGVVELTDLHRVLDECAPPPAAASYALSRATAHCRSPKESELLQVWERLAGFPRPLMNHQVLNERGRVVAVVDLLDVEAGVVGEYNGAAHRSRERMRRDEARASDLRDLGLEVFTLVAGDSQEVWLDRMRAARQRAAWLPEHQRTWRVGQFVPTPPLPVDAAGPPPTPPWGHDGPLPS